MVVRRSGIHSVEQTLVALATGEQRRQQIGRNFVLQHIDTRGEALDRNAGAAPAALIAVNTDRKVQPRLQPQGRGTDHFDVLTGDEAPVIARAGAAFSEEWVACRMESALCVDRVIFVQEHIDERIGIIDAVFVIAAKDFFGNAEIAEIVELRVRRGLVADEHTGAVDVAVLG